jgi:hypothetical protein
MAATCIIQPIDMVKVRLQLGATGGPVSTNQSAWRHWLHTVQMKPDTSYAAALLL